LRKITNDEFVAIWKDTYGVLPVGSRFGLARDFVAEQYDAEKEKRNVDELKRQIRRLVDRALRDLREDFDEFFGKKDSGVGYGTSVTVRPLMASRRA
jgi:hypothetical protein